MSWEISWAAIWFCNLNMFMGFTGHVLFHFTGEWLSQIKRWSTLDPWSQHAEVSFNLKVQRGQIHDWLHALMVAVPDDQKVPMKLMEVWKTVDFKRQKLVQVSLPLNENCKCSWGCHLKRIQGLVEKANALKWKYRKHVSYPSSSKQLHYIRTFTFWQHLMPFFFSCLTTQKIALVTAAWFPRFDI